MSTLLAIGLAPILYLIFWLLTSALTKSSFPPPSQLRQKRIVLLIAHPDDEAMFFAPTLLSLTAPHLGNHLKILCLSTGNADGLGKLRRTELIKSAMRLGIKREDDIFIVDDESKFRDNAEMWKEDDIAHLLAQAFTSRAAKERSLAVGQVKTGMNGSARTGSSLRNVTAAAEAEKPSATIDVLITFDAHGISEHPNHRSLYYGATTFLQQLMRGHSGWECPVTLYTLPSINILRKYSAMLDAPMTMFLGAFQTLFFGNSQKPKGKSLGGERVLFVSGMRDYWKARGAMVDGHKSQMIWFRWGWISIGRYLVVNDLKRERIVGS